MSKPPTADELIESAKFRVLSHLSSITVGFLVITVVVPLLGWNIITTQQLVVASAQDRSDNNGRMNALSDRITGLSDTDTRIFNRIDKLDDRLREVELKDTNRGKD